MDDERAGGIAEAIRTIITGNITGEPAIADDIRTAPTAPGQPRRAEDGRFSRGCQPRPTKSR